MSLRCYRIGNYAHSFEKEAFAQTIQVLRSVLPPTEEALLVGNYRIQGVVVGALLLCQKGVMALVWSNETGAIVGAERGEWLVDGRSLKGGRLGRAPVAQLRALHRKVKLWIEEQHGSAVPVQKARVAWVFSQQVKLCTEALSKETHTWLDVETMDTLVERLKQWKGTPVAFTDEDVCRIEKRLQLDNFLLDEYLNPPVLLEKYTSYLATAGDFFHALSDMVATEMDVRARCQVLYDTLQRATEERLRHTTILFSGLFPKMEHLFHEYDAPEELVREAHEARSQLRRLERLSDTELIHAYPYYLRAVVNYVALIYGNVPVPQDLMLRLPKDHRSRTRSRRLGEVLRVRVEHWNVNYIYAKAQDTGEVLKIDYVAMDDFSLGDGSYIKDLLTEGCQLNLIRPRLHEGEAEAIVYPELIIYEPDYLVNISSVAQCFEPYGALPYLQLIQRLVPFNGSMATVLGNFSGQLLDEALRHEDRSAQESFQDFFHTNALSLSTIELDSDKLEREGEEQWDNIHTGLTALKENGICDLEQVVLEPTFFSERLGLMGRMDFLQLDKSVVVEQKSGKGAYGSNPMRPLAQEPHFVQLNLYRALLHYGFNRPNKDIRTLFLYSKYGQPVVDKGHAPELLFESIKMRNQIVWCDYLYANEGFGLLEQLSPEDFRRKAVSDRFWQEWCEPKLLQVLQPVREASPLARAYCLRYLQFVQKELLHAKLGNAVKSDAGFATTWQASLDEKVKAGNIYYGLQLQFSAENAIVSQVHFSLPESEEMTASNFQRGDMVILYPYEEVPNACGEMVLRAIVTEMTSEAMTLEFLYAQTSSRIFTYYAEKGFAWAVEHDFLESTFSALFRGVHALLTTDAERRNLLLCQRAPQVNETLEVQGSYGAFTDLVRRAKQARDCFLILGPPGTGKTSHGLLTLVKEELLEADASILLMAYTNRAVDEICEKLIEEGIDFLRLGKSSTTEVSKEFLFEHRVQMCATPEEARTLMANTRIFCATTATLNGNMAFFATKSFSLGIIDEASQLLEPQVMGILTAMNGDDVAVRRFVFIGDHKQLPAVVAQDVQSSIVTDPLLQEIGLTDCRRSLFERLYAHWGADERHCYMLTKQGRMHEQIAAFPNVMFYEGKLGVVPLPHQMQTLSPKQEAQGVATVFDRHRLAFIAPKTHQRSPNDKVNLVEAEMIVAMVEAVWKKYQQEGKVFNASSSVGVIVPYRNQIAMVRKALSHRRIAPELSNITIDTVERFQGSQRDIIIYGFTIGKAYQLNFLTANTFEENGYFIDRKLNVAMTRAKEHLVLVGDATLLEHDPIFAKLIRFIREQGAFYEIAPQDFLEGRI